MKKILLATVISLTLCSSQTVVAQSTSSLTSSEKEFLLLMREEEKLARDVYITLGKNSTQKVFKNIQQSESRHMDAIENILNRYNIPDPIKNNQVGVFTNPKLDTLYKELIAAGDNELAALKIGAEIEDLDIADLMQAINETDKTDLINVYNNLLRGSHNHLRAFMRQINRLGGSYEPKYISQAQFNEILNGSHEKGRNKK